jgi:hypothetical protein
MSRITQDLSPEKLPFQRDVDRLKYNSDINYLEQRDTFNDAAKRSMVDFNSKDLEEFPNKHVLTGIQEIGPFSRAFFSKDNMNWLHSNMRFMVYKKSNNSVVISRQKDEQLIESMRRNYLEHSRSPDNVEEIISELARLNDIVLNETVPRILSEVNNYRKYLKDIETIRTPITLPINSSITGTKLYERGPADVLGLNV